jgi:NhaP-type Na+/H+ or K+/H+ antiporter
VVFALNIFAFIFIGLQIRPILAGCRKRTPAATCSLPLAVLVTVIAVRIAWYMTSKALIRLNPPPKPDTEPWRMASAVQSRAPERLFH